MLEGCLNVLRRSNEKTTKAKKLPFLYNFEIKMPLGVNKKWGTEYIYSRVGEVLKKFGATKV